MLQKLASIEEKFRTLTTSLSDPTLVSDPQKLREISKERAELGPVVKKYEEYKKVKTDIEGSKEILNDADVDDDLKELAEQELKELEEAEEKIEEELKILLLPSDPNDAKDVLLEIRAGAGG
ncbi:MAG: PCRF domain-containing protein, partial [Candidatus Aminicenantes bacterium]